MTTAYAYTTSANMIRFAGEKFITSAADHDRDGVADADVLDDAIDWASAEIDQWLAAVYSTTSMAANRMVERWATLIACCYLAIDRGNPMPASWKIQYDRLLDPETGLFIKASQGLIQLTGISLNGDGRPTYSNLTIDRRYLRSKVRVTRMNSSDAPSTLKQNTSQDFPSVLQ